MKKHDEELFIPSELLVILLSSPQLRYLGRFGEETALVSSLYSGKGFFLLVDSPNDGVSSYRFYLQENLVELKDALMEELSSAQEFKDNKSVVAIREILKVLNRTEVVS